MSETKEKRRPLTKLNEFDRLHYQDTKKKHIGPMDAEAFNLMPKRGSQKHRMADTGSCINSPSSSDKAVVDSLPISDNKKKSLKKLNIYQDSKSPEKIFSSDRKYRGISGRPPIRSGTDVKQFHKQGKTEAYDYKIKSLASCETDTLITENSSHSVGFQSSHSQNNVNVNTIESSDKRFHPSATTLSDLLLWRNCGASSFFFVTGILILSGIFSETRSVPILESISTYVSLSSFMSVLLFHVALNKCRSLLGLPPWPEPHNKQFLGKLKQFCSFCASSFASILASCIGYYVKASVDEAGSTAATASIAFLLIHWVVPLLPNRWTPIILFVSLFTIPIAVNHFFGDAETVLEKFCFIFQKKISNLNSRKKRIALVALCLAWLWGLNFPEKMAALTISICLYQKLERI